MPNHPQDAERELLLYGVLLRCTAQDAGRQELNDLKLVIVKAQRNTSIDLVRMTNTTWTQEYGVPIPLSVPREKFTAVVTSETHWELGYAHKNLSERSDTAQYLLFDLEPTEDDGPKLSILFWLRDPVSTQMLHETDADTSELLRVWNWIPDEYPSKAEVLNSIGHRLLEKFKTTKNRVEIDESVNAYDQALGLLSVDDARFSGFLVDAAMAHRDRFGVYGDIEDINNAIDKGRILVAMCPDKEQLSYALGHLGGFLSERSDHTGGGDDLAQAIQLLQRAVDLIPEGRSDLPFWLGNLGSSLSRRFEQTGAFADLQQAIQCMKRALALFPDDHLDYPSALCELGMLFVHRFQRTQGLADLEQSIQLQQKAISLTSKSHMKLPSLLHNLGTTFLYRFERTGDLIDIGQSIQLEQQAVDLTPEGHADLPGHLNNLGNAFYRRFEQEGNLSDIGQSIRLQQQAVDLTPMGHPHLPTRLENLGNSFSSRFGSQEDPKDLEEAIRLQHMAVDLTPEGHALLPIMLTNLGGSLFRRFQQTGDLTDVELSIQFQKRALELYPEGHSHLLGCLSNLGASYLDRFSVTGKLTDVEHSIQFRQRAVDLSPEGHTSLPSLLTDLGQSFFARFTSIGRREDLLRTVACYRTSALSISGRPTDCLNSARKWALLSSKISESEVLEAYGRVIDLMTLVAGLENTPKRRHEILAELSGVSTKAAAAALSVNQPSKALEWLEAGRCIVWTQINNLRTPLDELQAIHPELTTRLTLLSRQLEDMGGRADLRKPRMDLPMHMQMSLETEAHNHVKLAREREKLLATIRNIPGFGSFLQPKVFAELMKGIPDDCVTVVINSDKSRSDALILFSTSVQPIVVPLDKFSYEKATNLADMLRQSLKFRGLRSRFSDEAHRDFRGMTIATKKSDVLQTVLHDMWTDLVEPILKRLPVEFQHSDGKCDLPHIRWCPTGPFAFLPIHAAGIYRTSGRGNSLAEFAISSYIPNLNILEKLGSPRQAINSNRGVLLVSQADTPGLPRIPFTNDEVERTSNELSRRGIRTATYKSEQATITVISGELEKLSCIHLACHASQDTENPLESAVHLYDGPLKLSEIMKKNLPNAELAFMSACQTSVGDEALPEEVVHLAAGMLTAGYRSVIATMWSIADNHAPDIAEDFYKCLLNDETGDDVVGLDITGSARALHMAVQALRRRLGASPEALSKWVPYVHFGI
ncbi:hypothetical protein CVT26_004703 [Gymnopilus dilepis]|uniref:CHAT domain-containing protein n=1 Tax=Gymnopilus dilepis TaxID=231916 RepID=A0A409XZC8_9AGAR|nr:hypothetical protein CVT26_004703 [Gymnopilus dilepis]